MKPILLLIMLLLILSASDCKKDKDCHYEILIKNSSSRKVVWGIVTNGIYGCRLDGEELTPTAHATYRPYNYCIEESLPIGQAEHIYIVDPDHFNEPGIFYDCDSIEIKNTILKHYVLYLEDLKKNNFTVTYP